MKYFSQKKNLLINWLVIFSIFLKKENFKNYKIGMLLSAGSVLLGIAREGYLIYLFGFTHRNDLLQLYLGIFYCIFLFVDPAKLACLNLSRYRSLNYIINCFTLTILPLVFIIGYFFAKIDSHLNLYLLALSALGGVLNVVSLLVIIYKQRFGAFVSSQIINVLPNFVLIPGIFITTFFSEPYRIPSIVILFVMVPILQLLLLSLVKVHPQIETTTLGLKDDIMICARHISSIAGEQIFQIIWRMIFLRLGEGFITLFTLILRVYLSARFIIIDSLIGSKLQNWKSKSEEKILSHIQSNNLFYMVVIFCSYFICYLSPSFFNLFAVGLFLIIMLSFYFTSIYRIIYFRVNTFIHNANLVLSISFFDLMIASLLYMMAENNLVNALFYIWFWYIAKIYINILIAKFFYKRILLVAS